MKTAIKILACAGVLLTAMAGCKEDKLMVFEGADNVYFFQSKWPSGDTGFSSGMTYNGKAMVRREGTATINAVVDSMTVSMAFLHPDLKSDTTFLPVAVAGRIADVDRRFGYEVLDSGTAVEGVDFRVLDAFIPAKSRVGGIVVELFRENAKDNVILDAKFRLVENDTFGVNYPWIKRTSTDTTMVTTLEMKVRWTDNLLPPTPWWNYDAVSKNTMLFPELGSYSAKKLFVFTDILNVPWNTIYNEDTSGNLLMTGNMAFAQRGSVYGSMLYKWLVRYEEQNGEPYLDENGEPMKAGAKYYQ
jgi:hypothetical protein